MHSLHLDLAKHDCGHQPCLAQQLLTALCGFNGSRQCIWMCTVDPRRLFGLQVVRDLRQQLEGTQRQCETLTSQLSMLELVTSSSHTQHQQHPMAPQPLPNTQQGSGALHMFKVTPSSHLSNAADVGTVGGGSGWAAW